MRINLKLKIHQFCFFMIQLQLIGLNFHFIYLIHHFIKSQTDCIKLQNQTSTFHTGLPICALNQPYCLFHIDQWTYDFLLKNKNQSPDHNSTGNKTDEHKRINHRKTTVENFDRHPTAHRQIHAFWILFKHNVISRDLCLI